MMKFVLLAVLFVAVSCEDDFEPTVEDLQALWSLLPSSNKPAPLFDEILSKMSDQEKEQLKQWLKQVSVESARKEVSMEFGEKDMQVLRRLVEKKVPGWETFLQENGLPTEAGRLRLYKELGYHRVSK